MISWWGRRPEAEIVCKISKGGLGGWATNGQGRKVAGGGSVGARLLKSDTMVTKFKSPPRRLGCGRRRHHPYRCPVGRPPLVRLLRHRRRGGARIDLARLAVVGSSGRMATMIRNRLAKVISTRHWPGLRSSSARFRALQKRRMKNRSGIGQFQQHYRTPSAGRPAGTGVRVAMDRVQRPLGWHTTVRLFEQLVVTNHLAPLESSAARLGTLSGRKRRRAESLLKF